MPAFQFNSNGIDAQYGGAGGLPPGRHPVVIVATALKPTKNNDGGYLELQLQAIDGPAKGLMTYDRLNLHNKNPQAVEIANKQLAAYCHVTGVFAFNTTEELHNKPFVVEMKPRTDNANQTEVAALFDMNGNEPGKAGSGAAAGGTAFTPPPANQGAQGGGNAWAGGGGGAPAADQGAGQGGGAWGGNAGGGAAGGAGAGGGWQQGGGAGAGGAGAAPWGGNR